VPIATAVIVLWLIFHGNYLISSSILVVLFVSFLSGRRLDTITTYHSFKGAHYLQYFRLINWEYLKTLPAYLFYPINVYGHRRYNIYFPGAPLTVEKDDVVKMGGDERITSVQPLDKMQLIWDTIERLRIYAAEILGKFYVSLGEIEEAYHEKYSQWERTQKDKTVLIKPPDLEILQGIRNILGNMRETATRWILGHGEVSLMPQRIPEGSFYQAFYNQWIPLNKLFASIEVYVQVGDVVLRKIIEDFCKDGLLMMDTWPHALILSVKGGKESIAVLSEELKLLADEVYKIGRDELRQRLFSMKKMLLDGLKATAADAKEAEESEALATREAQRLLSEDKYLKSMEETYGRWLVSFQEVILESLFLATTYNDEEQELKQRALEEALHYTSLRVQECARRLLSIPLPANFLPGQMHRLSDYQVLWFQREQYIEKQMRHPGPVRHETEPLALADAAWDTLVSQNQQPNIEEDISRIIAMLRQPDIGITKKKQYICELYNLIADEYRQDAIIRSQEDLRFLLDLTQASFWQGGEPATQIIYEKLKFIIRRTVGIVYGVDFLRPRTAERMLKEVLGAAYQEQTLWRFIQDNIFIIPEMLQALDGKEENFFIFAAAFSDELKQAQPDLDVLKALHSIMMVLRYLTAGIEVKLSAPTMVEIGIMMHKNKPLGTYLAIFDAGLLKDVLPELSELDLLALRAKIPAVPIDSHEFNDLRDEIMMAAIEKFPEFARVLIHTARAEIGEISFSRTLSTKNNRKSPIVIMKEQMHRLWGRIFGGVKVVDLNSRLQGLKQNHPDIYELFSQKRNLIKLIYLASILRNYIPHRLNPPDIFQTP
jgi:hypothetical protein